MVLPLLTTKLNPPPLGPDLIQRPQLIERLNEGINGKLIMLSAPAGFGKTTAVIQWLRQANRANAWVSLDNDDNDPSRFFTYFISSLQSINQNFGKGIQTMLQMPQAPPVEAVISELINDIAAFNNQFILVLDDYHQIDNQQIHELIAYFIEHQPKNIQLVISTRYDLPISLSRLRSQRQLTEIRSADLRFTKKEITLFLNEIMDLGLTPKDIDSLEDRTEGWIATLQLLALSLQGREDKEVFVAAFSGSHKYIVDFLVDEIMANQPKEIQNFLFQTSILERVCATLADAVLDIPNSQKLLTQIARENLLIIPLDDDRVWYRYHHLFVDYLQQRLKANQPELISSLNLRAASWYKNNGYLDDAVKHGLQAKAYYFVADMIEENAENFWWRGDHSRLNNWLIEIPDEIISTRPGLSIGYAITNLMAGQSDETEMRLRAAERALQDLSSQSKETEFKGVIAAVRATNAFLIKGDVPAAIEFSKNALELLPEENAIWRSVVALNSGDAHTLTGDLEAAKRNYLQAAASSKRAENLFLHMVSSAKLAGNYSARGHLRAGSETVHQALDFAKHYGIDNTPQTALLYQILADIMCEWNQLDEAGKVIDKGIELSERANNILFITWSYRTLTKILFSKGDIAGAEEAIGKLEIIADKTELPSFLISSLIVWRARIEIAKGKKDKSRLTVLEHFLEDHEINPDDEIFYNNFWKYFSLARLLIAQKKLSRAEILLNQLLEISDAWGYTNGVIELRILQSITLYGQDKKEQAVALLTNALSQAESEKYVRVFVDEGEPVYELLKLIRARGIYQNYVEALLAAFPSSTTRQPRKSGPPLVEQLSSRELEVLKMLATELSVPEIADELMISANTVRTHTRNIFAKLQVNNRRSAVRRAKELELI